MLDLTTDDQTPFANVNNTITSELDLNFGPSMTQKTSCEVISLPSELKLSTTIPLLLIETISDFQRIS